MRIKKLINSLLLYVVIPLAQFSIVNAWVSHYPNYTAADWFNVILLAGGVYFQVTCISLALSEPIQVSLDLGSVLSAAKEWKDDNQQG